MKTKKIAAILLCTTVLLGTSIILNSCNKHDDEPESEWNNNNDDNGYNNGNNNGGNDNGGSDNGGNDNGGESGALSAPTGFNASQTSSYVKLTWNAVRGASGYYVGRSMSPSDDYSIIAKTTSTSYSDYEVTSGNTYYYAVTALNSSGAYGELATTAITFKGDGGSNNGGNNGGNNNSTVSAPTGVTASNEGSAMVPNIVIRWNEVSGAASYKIYRSSSANGSYSLIGTREYGMTVYGDQNPLNGTNYYKVSAISSSGKESEKSAYASATYEKDAVSPCPPSLTGTATSTQITMRWSYSTSNGCGKPTKVTVKVYNPMGGQWAEMETLSASTTSYSFAFGMWADSDGFVKMGILVENDYGTAAKQIIYNYKTKKWY